MPYGVDMSAVQLCEILLPRWCSIAGQCLRRGWKRHHRWKATTSFARFAMVVHVSHSRSHTRPCILLVKHYTASCTHVVVHCDLARVDAWRRLSHFRRWDAGAVKVGVSNHGSRYTSCGQLTRSIYAQYTRCTAIIFDMICMHVRWDNDRSSKVKWCDQLLPSTWPCQKSFLLGRPHCLRICGLGRQVLPMLRLMHLTTITRRPWQSGSLSHAVHCCGKYA